MPVRRALQRVFSPAIIAISFISFTHSAQAQPCQMALNETALKVSQERAAAGDASAECGLGRQYEFALGVPQDNQQAVLWLQKSAEQGDLDAQTELGVVFSKMQDYAQALVWYRKAAEQGHPRAEYNLGLAYQNGEAVPKDMEQSIAWYHKAADQGDVLAEMNLAVVYDQGLGIPRNYPQAAAWYRKAADHGLPQAQYNLGLLYRYGRGVPEDDTQAVAWMLKAAEQGETGAQYNVGAAYANGVGISRDLNEGYFWIYLANARTTDGGLKEQAGNTLEKLAEAMKKSDVKSAEKRAQAWLKKHPPLKTDE
ncbi:MAG TPA: tetratricopeptide repeat protein [Terracidiphilus sp.]